INDSANGKNRTMQFEFIDGGYRCQNGKYQITLRFSQSEGAPTIEEALVEIAKKKMNEKT
ncbi:MAG: hypothetical protein K2L02_06520, partial [Clostridia bacterium]|nr:hypothetical protein [Clostridia bacterium]